MRLPRLGKRELILLLFDCLFDLRLFGFVCFLFLLVSGGAAVCDCGTSWTFLLPFFFFFFFFFDISAKESGLNADKYLAEAANLEYRDT